MGDIDDLKASFEQVVEAFNARDPDAYLAVVHDEAVLFWISPFSTDGKAAIRETLQTFFANREGVTATQFNAQFRVIGTTGLAWGYYGLAAKLKDGPIETSFGRYTFTFTKLDGRWLVVSLHTSPPLLRN